MQKPSLFLKTGDVKARLCLESHDLKQLKPWLHILQVELGSGRRQLLCPSAYIEQLQLLHAGEPGDIAQCAKEFSGTAESSQLVVQTEQMLLFGLHGVLHPLPESDVRCIRPAGLMAVFGISDTAAATWVQEIGKKSGGLDYIGCRPHLREDALEQALAWQEPGVAQPQALFVPIPQPLTSLPPYNEPFAQG